MYCKNCRAVTDGTHFNAVNPPVIDNRLSDGENQLSPRIVRTTKKRKKERKRNRKRERRRVFLHLRLVQASTVPRARPDPFDSRGDQWRTKVTHMQAAHRSWLVSDPHGCLPATHKTRPWRPQLSMGIATVVSPRSAPAMAVGRKSFPYN